MSDCENEQFFPSWTSREAAVFKFVQPPRAQHSTFFFFFFFGLWMLQFIQSVSCSGILGSHVLPISSLTAVRLCFNLFSTACSWNCVRVAKPECAVSPYDDGAARLQGWLFYQTKCEKWGRSWRGNSCDVYNARSVSEHIHQFSCFSLTKVQFSCWTFENKMRAL